MFLLRTRENYPLIITKYLQNYLMFVCVGMPDDHSMTDGVENNLCLFVWLYTSPNYDTTIETIMVLIHMIHDCFSHWVVFVLSIHVCLIFFHLLQLDAI